MQYTMNFPCPRFEFLLLSLKVKMSYEQRKICICTTY